MFGGLEAATGEASKPDPVLQLADDGFNGGLSALVGDSVAAAFGESLGHRGNRGRLSGLGWPVGFAAGGDQPVRAVSGEGVDGAVASVSEDRFNLAAGKMGGDVGHG